MNDAHETNAAELQSLIIEASNLAVAHDLCRHVSPEAEYERLRAMFKGHLIEKLTKAAALIALSGENSVASD